MLFIPCKQKNDKQKKNFFEKYFCDIEPSKTQDLEMLDDFEIETRDNELTEDVEDNFELKTQNNKNNKNKTKNKNKNKDKDKDKDKSKKKKTNKTKQQENKGKQAKGSENNKKNVNVKQKNNESTKITNSKHKNNNKKNLVSPAVAGVFKKDYSSPNNVSDENSNSNQSRGRAKQRNINFLDKNNKEREDSSASKTPLTMQSNVDSFVTEKTDSENANPTKNMNPNSKNNTGNNNNNNSKVRKMIAVDDRVSGMPGLESNYDGYVDEEFININKSDLIQTGELVLECCKVNRRFKYHEFMIPTVLKPHASLFTAPGYGKKVHLEL